jgi:hypothetical protein
MKKYVIITLLCLFSTFSYGQTKEETISWLKEKLTSCLYVDKSPKNLKLVRINECEFVVEHTWFDNKGGSWYKSYTIPNANIVIKEGKITSELDVIKYYWKDPFDTGTKFQKEVYTIQIRECEPDIYVRIQKAMEHLATFCPKKKETF